jgi:hypothetical protein
MGFTVGDEADVGGWQGRLAKMIDERAYDTFPEAALLMLWVNGYIYDLVEEAAIADDTAHAYGFAVFADDDGVDRVGQSGSCGLCTLWA